MQKPDEETSLLPGSAQRPGSKMATAQLILMSGAGLFADGWDIMVINLALGMLELEYSNLMTARAKAYTATMLFVGVIVGQAIFGILADIAGRKLCSLATAFLTIGGVVASACVVDGSHLHLPAALGLCRLIAGLGIGGEYPLSAAITKEAMSQTLCLSRVQLLMLNLFMFSFGAASQALLVLILVGSNVHLEVVWRLAFGLGAVPSIIAVYFRLQMEEPITSGNRHIFSYVGNLISSITVLPAFLGCCLSWMVFNFASYGLMTLNSVICNEIFGTGGGNQKNVMRHAIFSLVGTIIIFLGNCLCWMIISCGVSQRNLQAFGFFFFGIFILLTCLCINIQVLATIFFFCGHIFLAIIGITTYVLPAEIIPDALRATGVGLSAASGKVGSVIGVTLLQILSETHGVRHVLLVSGCVTFAGVITTMVFLPSTANMKT